PPTSPLFPYTTLFRSPGGSRLELHYDDNQVRYAGAQVSDDEHPRYDNPYARVAWQQNRYVIEHRGHSLLHDIHQRERQSSASVSDRKSTRLNSSHVAI